MTDFTRLTSVIVILGVEKGIEKFSKVLMPLLIVLAVAISVYICTIPGALDGVKYYLLPDFSKFSLKTVCAAMGQMFYSMSLAMGIMITYGSYTRDDVSLVKSVNQIEIFDTIIALLAGMMVIPAVYVFSGEAGMSSGGAGLMFIRLKSCAIIFVICIILGVPSSLGNGIWSGITLLGMDFLTFFDYISNSVIMPIVALCTSILIGWNVGTKIIIEEVCKNGEHFKRKTIYELVIKYIAPVFLIVILVVYSLAQFNIISL